MFARVGQLEELGRRGERAGELDGERVDVGVDDSGDEHVKAFAGLDALVEGGLGDFDEALQPFGAERLEQLVLARVAAVQGAQTDAGAPCDGRDRRGWIGEEHLSRGSEDQRVVAGGLGAAAAHRDVGAHADIVAERNAPVP